MRLAGTDKDTTNPYKSDWKNNLEIDYIPDGGCIIITAIPMF